MDLTSFANTSLFWLQGTTAHVYPVSHNHIHPRMLGPNGLFAHRPPIASTGFRAADILGFVRCRFDLSAIKRYVSQPWLSSFVNCY